MTKCCNNPSTLQQSDMLRNLHMLRKTKMPKICFQNILRYLLKIVYELKRIIPFWSYRSYSLRVFKRISMRQGTRSRSWWWTLTFESPWLSVCPILYDIFDLSLSLTNCNPWQRSIWSGDQRTKTFLASLPHRASVSSSSIELLPPLLATACISCLVHGLQNHKGAGKHWEALS